MAKTYLAAKEKGVAEEILELLVGEVMAIETLIYGLLDSQLQADYLNKKFGLK